MLRLRAHSARLLGLSDGVRDGAQNVLLYLLPGDGNEPCAIALDLEDARELLAALAVILPDVVRSHRDLNQSN